MYYNRKTSFQIPLEFSKYFSVCMFVPDGKVSRCDNFPLNSCVPRR